MKKFFTLLVLKAMLCFPLLACSSSGASIEQVLRSAEPPAGVVIEIVTGDKEALKWALPLAKDYISRLRKKFPDIALAIVSHGKEQFGLQTNKSTSNKKVHSLTQSLKKENVNLHVCGTYASWHDVSEEEFPSYVDVAPAGPAQINDYLALDYKLIVIDSGSKP